MGCCQSCLNEAHEPRSLNGQNGPAHARANGQNWGGGQRLGGGNGSAPKTADERRELQRIAAEKRNGGAGNNAQRDTRQQNTSPPKQNVVEPELAIMDRGQEMTNEAREKAAAAAEARARNAQGISNEKSLELEERSQKDALIGKITHYYNAAGNDPPFGLASCSIEVLKKQLEYAKTLKK